MTGLDLFALLILIIMFLSVIAVWVVIGAMPGKIAKARNHRQAEAVNVCGWCGVLTLGLLLPIAFIWAYYDPDKPSASETTNTAGNEAAS